MNRCWATIVAVMRDSSASKYLFLSLAPMEQAYSRTFHKSQPHQAPRPTRYVSIPFLVRKIPRESTAPGHDPHVVNPHELRPDERWPDCHLCPLELPQSLRRPAITTMDDYLCNVHRDGFHRRHQIARDSRIILCAGWNGKLAILPFYLEFSIHTLAYCTFCCLTITFTGPPYYLSFQYTTCRMLRSAQSWEACRVVPYGAFRGARTRHTVGSFGACPKPKLAKCPTFNAVISAPELHLILRLERFAIACTDPASIPGEATRGNGENDDCQ
jgi:hypothetical protein